MISSRFFCSSENKISKSLGHADLAENVKNFESSRESKQLVQSLNKTELENWAIDKMSVMENVIRAKFDSCDAFREALLNTKNKELIEATTNQYWGCGLPKSKAKHIKSGFHPGKNILGELLMIVRNEKIGQSDLETMDSNGMNI